MFWESDNLFQQINSKINNIARVLGIEKDSFEKLRNAIYEQININCEIVQTANLDLLSSSNYHSFARKN